MITATTSNGGLTGTQFCEKFNKELKACNVVLARCGAMEISAKSNGEAISISWKGGIEFVSDMPNLCKRFFGQKCEFYSNPPCIALDLQISHMMHLKLDEALILFALNFEMAIAIRMQMMLINIDIQIQELECKKLDTSSADKADAHYLQVLVSALAILIAEKEHKNNQDILALIYERARAEILKKNILSEENASCGSRSISPCLSVSSSAIGSGRAPSAYSNEASSSPKADYSSTGIHRRSLHFPFARYGISESVPSSPGISSLPSSLPALEAKPPMQHSSRAAMVKSQTPASSGEGGRYLLEQNRNQKQSKDEVRSDFFGSPSDTQKSIGDNKLSSCYYQNGDDHYNHSPVLFQPLASVQDDSANDNKDCCCLSCAIM